jgi:hypothetical protein
MCLRNKIILALLLFATINTQAQLSAGTFGKVNIASPNAASLGKYGDIPVSYHTGIPNISIPIYAVKDGNLSVPIQLSYHAAGIKVDDNASWVGTGWTLQAGGVITRTVKDKPDERRVEIGQLYGYMSNYGLSNYILNNDANSQQAIDQEPDLFSFNFNGISGKFYLDETRKPVTIPDQDIKIEFKYEDALWTNSPGVNMTGIGKSIEGFTITTSDGTKYYFGIPDESINAPYSNPVEIVSTYSPTVGLVTGKIISSWYLYKIVSSNGVNQIDFKYKQDRYAFYSYPSVIYGQQSPNANMYYAIKNLMTGVVLSTISSSANSIEFVPGSARQDLARWSISFPEDDGMSDNVNASSPTLGSIKIYDTGSHCIKKFNFSYSYFDDYTTPTLSYFNWINTDRKRLKLNAIQEISGDDAIVLPPHSFDYFNELVPRRMSFGKDHWGFINGVTTNTMLYPELFNNNGSMNAGLNISINNRESAWPAMRAGTIKRITYPTGGYTDFDFEPNLFTVNGIDKIVGGLRIKTITSTDPIMNHSVQTSYDYNKAGSNLSSGVLFSKPTYAQLLRNDWHKKLNPLGTGGNGCFTAIGDNAIQLREILLSDNSVRPMETTQGYHIGYGYIKVSKTGNGYSTYQYSVSTPWNISWGNGVATTYINNPGICDINIPTYPAVPLQHDYYRGELQKESHYAESGLILNQKEYQSLYQQNTNSIPGILTHLFSYVQAGPNSFTTYYGIKTAKKIASTVIEKNYDPNGNYTENFIKSTFQSPYHNQASSVVSYNSLSDTLLKKNQYAFDIRPSSFNTELACNNNTADFMLHLETVYTNYASSFISYAGSNPTYYNGTLMPSFWQAVFTPRNSYMQCLRNARTQYQQIHDQVKSTADQSLKPIMWMQDIYQNALLETSEWKNSNLIRSIRAKHTNERDDEFGIYPTSLQKIELNDLVNNFTPISINANATSLLADSRYNDLLNITYYKGNPVNQFGRDGVNTAYDWDYSNQSPIVKIVNAYNLQRESSEIAFITKTANFTLGSSFSNSGNKTVTFTHVDTSDITFTLGNLPPNARVTGTYTLTGPGQNAVQYYLCAGGNGAATCNNVLSSVVLPAMLPGTYTLNIVVNTNFDSYQFSFDAKYTYKGKTIILIGNKEYYYEGFESSVLANNNTGYTGYKSYSGNFPINFTPPNTRNYIIQWWSYANNKWNFNQQAYTPNTVLSGIIDEIRVYPSDAQMTTYAYDSRYGLIDICDVNNRKNSYIYDRLGRLKAIKDQDGNIIKTFDYNYKN